MNQVYLLSKEQFEEINHKLDSIEQKLSSNNSEKSWLTNEEAMKLLQVSQTTLWKYRNEGKIKASRINRKLYYSMNDIHNLLESSK